MSRTTLMAIALAALTLSACVSDNDQPQPYDEPAAPLPAGGPPLTAEEAARNFSAVVTRMEPLVEAECRARQATPNCDFDILVDTTPGAPANAYQTLDRTGRPVLAFTLALISDARNQNELAFVMGHEASHHILNHIPREQQTAMLGSALSGVLAATLGGDQQAIQTAQKLGSTVGARSYSKDFELEADQLGATLAYDAGYDPMIGVAFFSRLPDPGDQFLGTHPPNAQRIALVRRTVEQLRGY